MSHALHRVHVHFVWATWDRMPLITPEIEPRLYGAIRKKCEVLKCPLLGLGGVENHIHLLVRLHPTVSQAVFAHQVKGASSHFVTHVVHPGGFFKWQSAYATFAVEPKSLAAVTRYIENQMQHHAQGSGWETLERIEDDTEAVEEGLDLIDTVNKLAGCAP
jgi:putative transposase